MEDIDMLAFISFLLVCVGSINWFCIGILQFDFVAGIFGSQSNVFSRLIYTLVGVASVIVIANFIMNKGKFVVSFKKANKDYNSLKEEKEENTRRRSLAGAENAEDFSLANKLNTRNSKNNTESGEDMADHSCENNAKCKDGHNCSCKNKNNKE